MSDSRPKEDTIHQGGIRLPTPVADDKVSPRDFGQAFGQAEIIRKEIPYRGYLLRRRDPFFLWSITDPNGMEVAGLGGTFTTLKLAAEAVDRFIQDNKQREEETLS